MQAGQLDRRITIQQKTETQDAVGDPVATWSTFAEVWAKKLHRRGAEGMKADREAGEREIELEIRYLPGVRMAMRIVFEGVNFDIEDIGEIGRGEGLRIRAVARGL